MYSCFRCSSVWVWWWTYGVNISLVSDKYLALDCDGRKRIFLSQALRWKLIVENLGSSLVLAQSLVWRSLHANPRFLPVSWGQPGLCSQPRSRSWAGWAALQWIFPGTLGSQGLLPCRLGSSASFFGAGRFNILCSQGLWRLCSKSTLVCPLHFQHQIRSFRTLNYL